MSCRILYINTQQVYHRTFVNLDSLTNGNTSTIDFMDIHLSLSLTHVVIYYNPSSLKLTPVHYYTYHQKSVCITKICAK